MDIEWGRDGTDGQLSSCRRALETVKSQEEGWSQPPLCDQRREKSVVRRSRHRPKSRPRQSAPGERRLGNGHRKSGRYFGYRHDRPRLGAGDEARFGNCDQPRRPHLPRRHYCARAGHSGRGGCGDATSVLSEGQEVTVSCAEGDTGLIYAGLLDVEVTDVAFG